jgi:hypothetical protein
VKRKALDSVKDEEEKKIKKIIKSMIKSLKMTLLVMAILV